MIIIGITGTLGAGKGTIVEYLVDKKGFAHYPVRGFLLEKIREMGLPENRDSMFNLANELRAEYGPSYVVDQLFEEAGKSGKNSIIESIRTTGEIASLRKKGTFYLFALDADPKLRFDRIQLRKSVTDSVSYETFVENEKRESFSTNPGVQNLRACIREADVILINNGTIEELYLEVDTVLKRLKILNTDDTD
ncbi:MAG: AAA family ATPase [Bacteroidia bacterium]|nr:AAA family ATPase [Bacteroidia bacterium]